MLAARALHKVGLGAALLSGLAKEVVRKVSQPCASPVRARQVLELFSPVYVPARRDRFDTGPTQCPAFATDSGHL